MRTLRYHESSRRIATCWFSQLSANIDPNIFQIEAYEDEKLEQNGSECNMED